MMDFFEVLDLPRACEVALPQLEARYRALQQVWHPDRKAQADEGERAAALRHASLINDAYETLKSPLRRAAHLLELEGRDVNQAQQSQLDPGFLMAQMDQRDRLEEAARSGDLGVVETLRREARSDFDVHWRRFVLHFEAQELDAAQRCYYELQFLQRFAEEVRAVEDRPLD